MNGQTTAANPQVARYFFIVSVVLGSAFGFVSDPSLSGNLGVLAHFVQWQLQTILPIGLLMLLQIALLGIPFIRRIGPWAALLITGLSASLLFAPVGLLIDSWFLGDPYTVEQLIDEFSALAPPIMVCWTAINAPLVLGFRWDSSQSASASMPPPKTFPEPSLAEGVKSFGSQQSAYGSEPMEDPLVPVASVAQPAFYQELPKDKRGQLIYLKSELHYLTVVTTKGRALILYNLRDAIEQLPPEAGLQTHRSYWVAIDQVVALRKTGRQGEVELAGGDRVPISRARLDAVTERIRHRI